MMAEWRVPRGDTNSIDRSCIIIRIPVSVWFATTEFHTESTEFAESEEQCLVCRLR